MAITPAQASEMEAKLLVERMKSAEQEIVDVEKRIDEHLAAGKRSYTLPTRRQSFPDGPGRIWPSPPPLSQTAVEILVRKYSNAGWHVTVNNPLPSPWDGSQTLQFAPKPCRVDDLPG